MSWDAIGALGEVVGAAAVVITLVYLAIQTRQNTRAVRHATERGVVEDANLWRYKVIESAEVSELFRSGLRDPASLDPNDRYRLRMMLDALFFHWQHAIELGVRLPAENVTRITGTPGGAWYWERARELFTPEFVAFVERHRGV
jgi:hypothetical protein